MVYSMKGTVIFISSVSWHFTWQIHHNLAAGLFKRGYQVIYLDPIPKRIPRLSEAKRVWGRLKGDSRAGGISQQPEIPGLKIVTPLALPDRGGLFQSLNRWVFVPWLARRINADGWERPLVVINYLPIPAAINLQQHLQPDLSIYHCCWDWWHDPYAGDLAAYEHQLAGQAQVILVDDAPLLQARMAAYQPRAFVHTLRHGVDYAAFEIARTSPRITDQPLCAYFGSIGASIDVDLLRQISYRYSLRLIGPVQVALEGFAPTTQIIGSVPHHRLPQYLADVDVLLLPYRRDVPHTQGIVPAKTFECLATGKPTLAIGLSTLEPYRDLFYLCHTPQEVFAQIPQVMCEDPQLRQIRLDYAQAHSWDTCLSTIESIFQSFWSFPHP
jgi:glycosyltransferase involved in cell wall biosynthesis